MVVWVKRTTINEWLKSCITKERSNIIVHMEAFKDMLVLITFLLFLILVGLGKQTKNNKTKR
jgi:uncharacterized protein YdeI (YjbR/CyaY-like superfamily)